MQTHFVGEGQNDTRKYVVVLVIQIQCFLFLVALQTFILDSDLTFLTHDISFIDFTGRKTNKYNITKTDYKTETKVAPL